MKVVAQKPIQSLHAFGRHFNGGSIAALPLLFTRNLRYHFFFLVFSAAFVFSLSAQQRDTNPSSTDEKRLDLLFEGIMLTLPNEMRSEVDSAASVKVNRRSPTATPENSRPHEPVSNETRLRELPDELKVQVERAIADMEKRKEERKAQFRESQRNR